NLKLWGTVHETSVSGTTYPGSTAGKEGGVIVDHDGTGERHFTFFKTPDGTPPDLDPGMFGFEGPSAAHIDSTYDFRALDSVGNPFRTGVISKPNIIIAAAEPVAATPKIINIRAITEIDGTGFLANSSDSHHIDVLTNGFITLAEKTDDLRVGRIMSTANDV